MSEIAQTVGKRIRVQRNSKKLTQEGLAERSGLHATYIGQLERGEKNATLESIEKIALALNIPLAKLFEKIGDNREQETNYPLMIYELVNELSPKEQATVLNLLQSVTELKRL